MLPSAVVAAAAVHRNTAAPVAATATPAPGDEETSASTAGKLRANGVAAPPLEPVTDDEESDVLSDTDATSVDSGSDSASCSDAPSASGWFSPGVIGAAGSVTIGSMKMTHATAQIGNVTNFHSPLTVVMAGEPGGGLIQPAKILTPDGSGGVVLRPEDVLERLSSAPLWTAVPALPSATAAAAAARVNGGLVDRPNDEESRSAAPAAPSRLPRHKLLRWPGLSVPILILAAAAALVTTVIVLLCSSRRPSEEIIDLKNGVRLAKRSFWHAREPKQAPDRLPTPVEMIIINHSGAAFCFDSNKCADVLNDIQSFHMFDTQHLWDDIGYNYMIGGDGVTYEGRGWDAVGAHTKGWNTKALGVAVIGNFAKQALSIRQRDQLQKFIEWGVELGKVLPDYRVAGACQVQNSVSPGLMFMEELRTWTHWWNYTYADNACTRVV